MEKSLYDHLNEFGRDDSRLVTNTLKALAYNGVTDIDILMKMKTEEIMKIKGIGPKSMVLIGKVITKEEMRRNQKMDVYEKKCHECECYCLRDWFKKAGLSHMSACQLERILKKNGIKTIENFLETEQEDFKNMRGIADKRLLTILKTKKMIKSKRKNYPEHCFAANSPG